MIIEQTVEIPAGDRLHLDLPLPRNHPAGKGRVVVYFETELAVKPVLQDSWRSLYGICKSSGDTIEAFLERKHADKAREDIALERRLGERDSRREPPQP